jgi:hypothetical protein
VLAALWFCVVGCAQPAFRDEPIVWFVDDARDIPQPEEWKFVRPQYYSDVYLVGRIHRGLGVPDREPAHNTNALDEVPNSTWWTNRIGVRDVSVEEAVTGTSSAGPPSLPLTVVGGKQGGRRPGFFAKDTTGRKFLIKFDFKDNPDQQTGTGVAVNRFFWTIGYNVPNDTIVYIDREEVLLSDDAKVTNEFGKKRAMTVADVDAQLATSPRQPDGRYRVLASEFLPGVPIGGIRPKSIRKDDPNDTIPHEHRRELRGLRVFSAWLGHTDMKEDNSIDMYVEQDGRHFVRHYLLDFGEALGAHIASTGRYEDGWEYNLDWGMQFAGLFTLGLWKRPWEDVEETRWPQVGAFSADPFDPVKWRSAFPYWPFLEADAADSYWAAKIIMRFDRPLIEALLSTAEFPDDATEYLADTLEARAHKIGMAYIESITAFDAFTVEGTQICGYDLSVVYGLAEPGTAQFIDAKGKVESEHTVDRDGRFCFDAPRGKYHRSRLRTRRGRTVRPPMELHFRGGATPSVLGIIRVARM